MKYMHTILPYLLSTLISGAATAQDVKLHKGCDCPTIRLDDAYCASSVVFEGTALGNDTTYAQSGVKPVARDVIKHTSTRFQVTRSIKGESSETTTVHSAMDADDCGFHFIPGKHYLVFATFEDGALHTDRCDATRSMDGLTPVFRDSLSYVEAGHRWEGSVPLDGPCK